MFDSHALRHTRRHLVGDEVVIASAVGIELDGRRRRVIVITDRRILVAWARGGPPVELALDGAWCQHETAGGLLTLGGGGTEVALRGVDAAAARALTGLLAERRPPRVAQAPPRLRVVGG